MGTPDFAAPALHRLYNDGHHILCVYSQPPRPAGRGKQLRKSPVQTLAEELGLSVKHPTSLKKEEAQQEFKALGADIAVVAAYGLILPRAVLEAPKYGCLNIHASLLPRWRGASPIQHAIWHGDTQSGVTIMQMDEGLDTGDMLLKGKNPINEDTNSQSLHDALSDIGANLISETLRKIAQTSAPLKGEPQENAKSCYAPLLKKEDGLIDWTKNARAIDCQVRALNPWPGTYIVLQDKKRLKVKSGTLINAAKANSQDKVATLLNKDGDVQCGDQTLYRMTEIQPEGKKPMDIQSALNGGYLKIGDVLMP
jgi:methionyl-tRNA formyltransferase